MSNGHQRFNAHIATANINIQSGGGTRELRIVEHTQVWGRTDEASTNDCYVVNQVVDGTDRNWAGRGPSECSRAQQSNPKPDHRLESLGYSWVPRHRSLRFTWCVMAASERVITALAAGAEHCQLTEVP